MGFTLKKILSAILMPLSLGLILGLIGLWFLYKNSYTKAKVFLTTSFVWIVIISYAPFSNFLIKPLETTYPKLEKIPQDAEHILLLGGNMENRAWEVLRLYNEIENVKIITSGYEGSGKIPEAIKTANILKDIGICERNIIIHSKPRDTKEEAIKIKKLLGKKPFILVTSSYHMPRAIALFRKEGLNPIPAPTDFKAKYNNALSVPQGDSLRKTETAWHEYLGLLWAKLRNQI